MTSNSKKEVLLIQVLKGIYPERQVTRMCNATLESFVKQLVKRTAISVSSEDCKFKKPKWWPENVTFNSTFYLSGKKLFYVRPILKQLVIKCSEYYRNSAFRQQWLPDLVCDKFYHGEENDENLNVINRGEKRKGDEMLRKDTKKLKLHHKNSNYDLPFILISDCFKSKYEPIIEPNFVLIPNQDQFLNYFGLNATNSPLLSSPPAQSHLSLLKLSNCLHVPFSSDIGKLLSNNENHSMSEDIKLRRLEKTEWYLSGKSVIKPTDQEYEVTYTRRNGDEDTHIYRYPKRQFCQEHRPIYKTPFVQKHMESAYVKLERLDLKKIQRRLKVYIPRMGLQQMTSYLCRDLKIVVVKGDIPETETNAIRRYSPRLRSL